LQSDGVIGAGTVAELNISPAMRREQLRINARRFRWLAQDLEPEGVLVNVAAAQLSVYQAVSRCGKPAASGACRTPDAVAQVAHYPPDLNPTWTIPPTIMREDKLPPSRNPEYLRQQNLQVLDAEGRALTPEQVDWSPPGNILLRQEAGPRNPWARSCCAFPTRIRCTCTTRRASRCSPRGHGRSARDA
jgi:murein L,D-transpeptidase YcbB/YkuD